MAYKDFINDFNKEITGDVLFFYGSEDYLMNWAVDRVIERYVEESARNLDVQSLDGSTCSAAEIMSAALAFSMLSEKKVIIVRNFLPLHSKTVDVDADRLVEFCSDKLGQAILLFIVESKYSSSISSYGKKILKASSSYEFDRLDKASLKGFINKRVHASHKFLGHREMDYLIDLSGYFNRDSEYDLGQLDSDLKKITNACADDNIDISLIDELLVGKEDKYVFNLVDALMQGDRKTAMELAETIISEDDAALPVLGLLIKQFEIMYDSLELSVDGMSISQMAKSTGVNEFRFKKAYQAARRFSRIQLKNILIKAYDIDRSFKTGEIDIDLAFELFVVSI